MNEMSDGVRYLYVFSYVCVFYALAMVAAMLGGYWSLTLWHVVATWPLWYLAGVLRRQARRLTAKEAPKAD